MNANGVETLNESVEIWLVGGAVRDIVMGRESNDFDFTVVAVSYEAMKNWIIRNNFEIFVETPKYFTIRARAPKDGWTFAGRDLSHLTFDFVLARKDGSYYDGRRPDTVEAGTLEDDIYRRDFRMNALAIDEDGELIDMCGGVEDIHNGIIQTVGGNSRFTEDGLRIIRAIRFSIQTGFEMSRTMDRFFYADEAIEALSLVSMDRIRDEVEKCFKLDTLQSIAIFSRYDRISELIFKEKGLWLIPSTKSRSKSKQTTLPPKSGSKNSVSLYELPL